jgi:hypothetical protein
MILNNTQEIDNDQQWVFVTLTVDGDECQFTHVAPVALTGQDLQDFVDAREDAYTLDILKDMYPDVPTSAKGTRADFEQWIIDGKIVPEVLDDEDNVITPEYVSTKVPWTNQHPDIISASGTEKANLLAAAKDLVSSLTYNDIDNHIETVFGNLNAAQQNSLKKLYKVVLYSVRR